MDRPSHNVVVRIELTLPERLTEHRHLSGSAAVAFIRRQQTTK
jgi:hypothetical protein